MAAPFKKQVRVLLEKDCEFQIGIRKGRVLELRKEGYLTFLEEWTDPDTHEWHESTAAVLSYEMIVTENNYGKLKILKRPLAKPVDPNQVRRSARNVVEINRKRFRKHFALAIQDMLDAGELQLTRDHFTDKIVAIVANGTQRYQTSLAAMSMRDSKRGGARVKKTKLEKERAVEFHQGFKSGHTMWKWYWAWRVHGDDGLFDKYRNCGKYKRYDDETEAFACRILSPLYDLERPTIKSMVESVQAGVDAENERRERLPVPAKKLKQLGYDYILGLIKIHAPIDSAIRKVGWDKAYKDMHALGVGIETSRAMERVEIDEYTIDLFVLMENTGLFDHLPASIRNLIGLDGASRRVTLSAAIDVHTRCLLALQIVPKALESPLQHTLEMIYTEKSPIADAAGAKFGWPMCGAPESIVLDRGTDYITDDAYDILAYLGITNIGAPAGKPWLKPFIERLFRTIHSDLLLRFSGRAFSNVVEKGENDSEGRATLTLEAFLGWLVRWTVDAYHTKKHSALGMSPAQAWVKATNECFPRSLSSDEMREVFGVRMSRKIGRKGVRVKSIYYQNDASISMKYTPGVEEVEVLRWDGDIGTISIRSDDGPWTTVSAADPMWIGKTDSDLEVWLSEHPDPDEAERIARRDFILDVNAEAYERKRIAGLVSTPKTAPDHEYDIERFARFANTAERQHAAGEYRDLLDDIHGDPDFDVDPLEQATTPARDEFDAAAEISDNDSME